MSVNNIGSLLLDFRVTSKCHLGCDLCFRTPGIEEQSLPEIQTVISKMAAMNFKRMGFTGGEPTLRSDYIPMIQQAKQLGFLTYLSTVGHRLISDLPKLDNILDWVGLPIDGITFDTNAAIRSPSMGNQHEVISDIFHHLGQASTKIKIKLTTVVSKANIFSLDALVSFVKRLPYQFQAWRFYQFCPLGIGKLKRDKLEISTQVFEDIMMQVARQFPSDPISWATFNERDKANVVMEPNFNVVVPDGENYTYLCNMRNDSDSYILSALTSRQDILNQCSINRQWVY